MIKRFTNFEIGKTYRATREAGGVVDLVYSAKNIFKEINTGNTHYAKILRPTYTHYQCDNSECAIIEGIEAVFAGKALLTCEVTT